MKAVLIARFGAPEVLQVVEVPLPQPGPGQVRIRVHAAGVNYFDCLMRADRYAVTPELPLRPGAEVAGVVDALGPGIEFHHVHRLQPGTRVAVPLFAVGQGGGYAEYVVADVSAVIRLPPALPFDVAVALQVQGLTALHLIHANPPAGRRVLVSAAAGGVGALYVQLAREAGARQVIAAASSAERLAFALAHGANEGVSYGAPDWTEQALALSGAQGVDLLIDLVGGAFTGRALQALAPGGQLMFGALGRYTLPPDELAHALMRNQSLRGFALLPLLDMREVPRQLAQLFERVLGGQLTVPVGARFTLDEAAAAHAAVESRRLTGKVVLRVRADHRA